MPQPGNPLAWDRYAGMFNNPIRFVDPTGHATKDCGPDGIYCGGIGDDSSLPEENDAPAPPGPDCMLVCKTEEAIVHVTWYYTPVANEFHSGQSVSVNVENTLLTLDREAVLGSAGMYVQGSLKVDGNKYINSLEVNGDSLSASWGFGNPNLIPFQSGAVGPNFLGATYYLPDFNVRGTKSNGSFLGLDRGGMIANGELDIYVGVGNAAIRNARDNVYSAIKMKNSGVFGDAGTSNFTGTVTRCHWEKITQSASGNRK